ncbi:hypothetical protein [Desulforegula conservatrix]|uniref:hypothetical protein n=1 Tax=Desulforegula conservatrix TaxID=153026 RepID=UPI000486A6B4|nr:hypothetical protein [Desulforegula conservatrix]
MQSIRAAVSKKLQDHGLWQQEAEAVMDIVEKAPENKAMQGRWHESPDAYSSGILVALWWSSKNHAIAWIDANKPEHFAREILAA